jgi:hypothetical protein
MYHRTKIIADFSTAGSEVDEPSVRYSLLGEAECNIFALKILENARVLSLEIVSIKLQLDRGIDNSKPHLDSVHKCVVYILGLHFLTDQTGNSSEDGVHCGDLAIPGEKRRHSSPIPTS